MSSMNSQSLGHVLTSLRFYMSCYQVNVGGSGSASPPTVKFPGAYSATDPGILINIYEPMKSYTSTSTSA